MRVLQCDDKKPNKWGKNLENCKEFWIKILMNNVSLVFFHPIFFSLSMSFHCGNGDLFHRREKPSLFAWLSRPKKKLSNLKVGRDGRISKWHVSNFINGIYFDNINKWVLSQHYNFYQTNEKKKQICRVFGWTQKRCVLCQSTNIFSDFSDRIDRVRTRKCVCN